MKPSANSPDLPAPRDVTITPCRTCGAPILIVSVQDGDANRIAQLDPHVPVYYRESDGEGGHVWLRDTSRQIVARHSCHGGRA